MARVPRCSLAHERSGWFLDYVKITDESAGLTFRADFNRWLAKDELDRRIDVTMPVPLGKVTLSKGELVSTFIGYETKRRVNGGPTALEFLESFASTVKTGFSLKKSTATSTSAGAKVGAEFFGAKCEFTVGVTQTALSELTTTEEQTLSITTQTKFLLQPGQALTAVCLYFQTVLTGKAVANGAQMDFEQRYPASEDIVVFDGNLTDAEVQQKVLALLRDAAQRAGGNPSQLPSRVSAAGAQVALVRKPVAGDVTASSLHSAMSALAKHVLVPESLAGIPKAKQLVQGTSVARLIAKHW
jgi:hypothetical protein